MRERVRKRERRGERGLLLVGEYQALDRRAELGAAEGIVAAQVHDLDDGRGGAGRGRRQREE